VSTASNPAIASTSSIPLDPRNPRTTEGEAGLDRATAWDGRKRLQFAELKIQLLEERLRQMLIKKVRASSEKLPSAQLELLELEPGVSSDEVQAEGEREPLSSQPAAPEEEANRKPGRKHPGRQSLPAHLPRVAKIVACTPEQCVCGGCGAETTLIGYEESEQLDVEPMKYFVRVTRREKRACKRCEERGVEAAPLPERIIEKSWSRTRS